MLAAAIDALLPGDSAHRGAGRGRPAPRRSASTSPAQGRWVADRVRVVDSLAEADAADVVIAAEPLTGTADEARGAVDGLAKYLADGAVLSVAAPRRPADRAAPPPSWTGRARCYGVGTDLVLRNPPPVRVHRLRFTPADAARGRPGWRPAYRPSSVPLTRGMHIDSNGVAAAGIALGLAALARVARPKSKLWLLPALAAAPVAAFFRDPERDVPGGPVGRGRRRRRPGAVGAAAARRALRRRASSCGSRSSCRCSTCTSTGPRWPARWSTTSSPTAASSPR